MHFGPRKNSATQNSVSSNDSTNEKNPAHTQVHKLKKYLSGNNVIARTQE